MCMENELKGIMSYMVDYYLIMAAALFNFFIYIHFATSHHSA